MNSDYIIEAIITESINYLESDTTLESIVFYTNNSGEFIYEANSYSMSYASREYGATIRNKIVSLIKTSTGLNVDKYLRWSHSVAAERSKFDKSRVIVIYER